MQLTKIIISISTLTLMAASTASFASSVNNQLNFDKPAQKRAQIGPRPYYLVEDMDNGFLKDQLSQCANKTKPFKKSDFAIGHRGAPLQFPEHTKESYEAAAQMGAGIVECDVTFTNDRELVCRHSQCDLHTTTNILATPLAEKCSQPFQPAAFDPDGNLIARASAQCCTSDISLEEFLSLKGKMDASNAMATNVEDFMNATADYRTDLYSQNGTLLTHAQSIELFKSLNVKMTPELKSPSVTMPFEGDYTQADYAQQMIEEYKAAGVKPSKVFPQSFNLDDVKYWIAAEPRFGKQAVYLDDRYDIAGFDFRDASSWSPSMNELVADGVKIIAPPMWMLLDLDNNGEMVPSTYALKAKAAGLKIITWTLERSGPLANGGGWYYQSVTEATNNDGDTFKALDVLAKQVGVIGVFSDWPATVSFYAKCMDL